MIENFTACTSRLFKGVGEFEHAVEHTLPLVFIFGKREYSLVILEQP